MIPVRCFTCGKILGNLEDTFYEQLKCNKSIKDILNDLNLKRYCCRAIMMTYSKNE